MGGRIFRRVSLLTAVGVLATGAATASAGKAIGGCPDSYQLIKAKVDPIADKNGDGWICTKQIGAPPGTTAYSDIDNNPNQ